MTGKVGLIVVDMQNDFCPPVSLARIILRA
jgi:nicotinamidase-related amidase